MYTSPVSLMISISSALRYPHARYPPVSILNASRIVSFSGGLNVSSSLYGARESLERNYDVNKEGCWIFNGSTNQIGYAVSHSYNLDSRGPATIVGAYKLSLYLLIRDDPTHDLHNIPLSQYGDVHHSCKVRNCINPEHLIEMTEELHTVLHNLHIKRIAISIVLELLDTYPDCERYSE